MDRLRVLFAGLGSIGQRHVRNLKILLGDDVEILAYRTRQGPSCLNADGGPSDCDLESKYGIRSFDQLDHALENRPDAVFITNPNTHHLPVAIEAARAGCHLFIEKPLSHSLQGVDELLEVVERKRLVAFVAYQFRFHPGLRLVKSILEQGTLGQIAAAHLVNGEYVPDWHPGEDYTRSHPARSELGGGCLRIQTHELDYALWLFGLPRRVFALGGHLSRLEIDVDDSVSLLMECTHEGRSFPVHLHLDYLQRPPQRVCEVVGDAGKVRYDYYANLVQLDLTESKSQTIHRFDGFDRNQMFLDELRHFLDCMKGDTRPVVDLREAISSMRITEAGLESLRTGHAIELS